MVDPSRLESRLRFLEEEVQHLRLTLLRVATVLVVVVILAGLFLPVFGEEIDGEPVTLRVATGWYVALVEPGSDGEGFVVLLGIGFAGLLLAVLALLWVLALEVLPARARPAAVRVAAVASTLAGIGSLVPAFFSLVTTLGDGPEEGGWGGVLLLAGVVAAAVLLTRERSWELWKQQR